MIDRNLITGLVLAGGRGTRMGGLDKGLQRYGGVPLALHAVRHLQPQVGEMLVSANRHLDTYASMGAAVCVDAGSGHAGPLAGFLAGLERCTTPFLVTVPCDAPLFPADLVARLADGLEARGDDMAMAATNEGDALRLQPVFCLMRAKLGKDLARYLREGGRAVDAWAATLRRATVLFADAGAFVNVNTLDELHALPRP